LPVEVKIIPTKRDRQDERQEIRSDGGGKLQWEGGIPEKKDIASWLHG
jgi:hypothetical protein